MVGSHVLHLKVNYFHFEMTLVVSKKQNYGMFKIFFVRIVRVAVHCLCIEAGPVPL